MPTGKVRWFDKKKGYGFVEYGEQDVFLHHAALAEDFIPENNEIISFEVEPGEKGLKAKNITKVG